MHLKPEIELFHWKLFQYLTAVLASTEYFLNIQKTKFGLEKVFFSIYIW